MTDFPKMVDIVKPGKLGLAEVAHFEVTDFESKFSALRGEYVPAGKYARLSVAGCLMMTDTAMERGSNQEAVWSARGRVLIAGLGIGMILHPILSKTEVARVTVIEKYQDVIDLVAPTIQSPKLSIACADAFEFVPEAGTHYDTIYFDIWPDISVDNLDEMTRLHRRFRKFLAPGGWMQSWQRDCLRYLKKAGRWR